MTMSYFQKTFFFNLHGYRLYVVYNSKIFLENMTRPFLKFIKGTFFRNTLHCKKKPLTGNCFERFKPFKIKYIFKKSEFTLYFKTKKRSYICFEIKGKFRSFEIFNLERFKSFKTVSRQSYF